MTQPFTRREFTFFYACGFLGCLFLCFSTTWWMILVGGNPPRVVSASITYADGEVGDRFRVGQLVYAAQKICADSPTVIQLFPSINVSERIRFPIKGGLIMASQGCHDVVQGFIIPPLPPGNYMMSTIFKFQHNLVGRDEFAAFPNITFQIIL